MKASLLTKLEALADRHQEVEALLGDAEVINDQNRFRDLSVEFAHLNDVVAQYQDWQQLQAELEGARQLLEDSDAEIKALATEEVAEASAALEEIESALQVLLLPRDPMTAVTFSLRSERAPVATRRRSFPEICSGCITAMPNRRVGQWKSCQSGLVNTAVTRN